MTGSSRKVQRSYFNGCSGGGRDAMVVASYFPEEFDGIIAGSAYNLMGTAFQMSGIGLAGTRSADARLTPALLSLLDATVKAQCDAVDGVKDGVIQNSAACNFRADRDLPICRAGDSGGQCFTQAQVETVSTILTAVTDDRGNVVQAGYSVSEVQVSTTRSALADPVHSIFVHRNDPAFEMTSIFALRSGGPGAIRSFRAVVPTAEVTKARAALAPGMGHVPEKAGALKRAGTKMLMWHNLSDEALTPYMSINYYKELAGIYGSYPRLQQQVRLFTLPGTSHCSISGIAPNSFDALAAIEDWVERGKAPDALRAKVVARQFSPGLPKAEALAYPNWTATLCKFPEMARYSGTGDVKDASNWACSPGDRRMLQVGESGRLAGVR